MPATERQDRGPRRMKWIALMLATLAFLADTRADEPVPRTQWVIDPSVPGADRPQSGVSLFDELTIGADGRQQIPFPFERLRARIEAAAGCSESRPCTRAVLIPLGRSLQRVAASPDFFRHPRVVAAVVGEGSGRLLRDRLYLGFQDKSGVVEVISYNETLGRFEFQIVRNYAPGRTPEVVYARRTVCIACHQNHGPIYSQPVWLETNANAQVAERLAQQQASFSGVAARGNTDISQAIDNATDRANLFALTQRLWMDGCGDGASGAACRRGIVKASLQFALTEQRAYARSGPDFVRDVSQVLARHGAALWPGGLVLQGADLPNRDPLDLHEGVTALLAANIETRFDPLLPRVPSQIPATQWESRLVRGAADFWSVRSRHALVEALARRSPATHRVTVPCRFSGTARLEQFDCASSVARLRGSLNGATGTIEEIAVADDEPVRHLSVDAVNRDGASVTLRVRSRRLPDGNAIDRIVLSRDQASIHITPDFGAIDDALGQMDLPRRPLDSSLLDALTAKLKGEAWSPLPPGEPRAPADLYTPDAARSDPLARRFETQCGTCHHTAEITPPNFLSGDAQRVAEALHSCGPRIFVRLAMRQVPAAQRVKSPMPPPMPSVDGQTLEHPPADERALVELQSAVNAALRQEYGHAVTLDELLRHGYESLRPCLPTTAAGEASHARTDS